MINIKSFIKKITAFTFFLCVFSSKLAFAQTESYIQSLTGVIKPKDICIAVDEKFATPELWAAVQKNVMVQNLITFEVRFDTTINFFNRSFDCELIADISYKDSAMREKKISDVKLVIHYDSAKGKAYKGIAYYKFAGGHEVTVTIKSITSKEIDVTKAAFLRLKNQILIDRTYKKRAGDVSASFSVKNLNGAKPVSAGTTSSNFGGTIFNNNRQILISWGSEVFEYDKFDLEYTFYDANSLLGTQNFQTGNVNQAILEGAFKNNATRVSVDDPEYVLNLVYPTGYLLVRIRAYTYTEVDGEMDREEGDWHYVDINGIGGYAVYAIAEHEQNLSWQYSAMFAEEGKRKEVVSYFDGGMKSRQSVTISNSDNVSIVAENVLDRQNRPAVSILPVPTTDNTIHFFPAFNRNLGGEVYDFEDFNASNICASTAAPMNISYGSSKYYSPNNPFAGNINYPNAKEISKDIPDAGGFPFAVTQFTNDQTGRIRRQGGVGSIFQLGNGKETSYYYGKPAQEELDRLFGSEAGAASHYSKNMVVDANGQVSVSYVDIAGKTVATSLAGTSPDNLKALESANNTVRTIRDELIRPQGIVRDADNLKVSFNSTIMVPTASDYDFTYQFNGRTLELLFGFNPEKKVCADCYYDVKFSISDDCGNPVALIFNGQNYDSILVPASFNYGNGIPNQQPNTLCGVVLPTQTGLIKAAFPKTGEYNVSYELVMSRKAMDYYMEYLKQLQVMKTEDEFKKDYLKKIDLTGCFNDCRDCREKLGTLEDFIERMKKILLQEDNVIVTTDDIEWITQLYNVTLTKCGQAETVGKNCSITDACADQRKLMLKDLTPSGQYMLYDETTLLFKERATNVFVTKIKGNAAITASVIINRLGTEQTVLLNSLEEVEVITQWNPDWAYLMLPHHPEYCLLDECESQSASKNRDKAMLQTDDDVAARTTYLWKREQANFTDFVNAEMALVSSPYIMQNIKDDINDKIGIFIPNVPIKNGTVIAPGNVSLSQFIWFMVYCDDKPKENAVTHQFPYIDLTNINAPRPCDKPLEEWRMFRNLYIAIKQDAYRNPDNKAPTECRNNYIGVNAFSSIYNEKASPTYYPHLKDFIIEPNIGNTGLQVKYNKVTPINNRCDVYVYKATQTPAGVTAILVEKLEFQENGANILPITNVDMNEKDLYFIESIENNYNHNIDGTVNPPTNCPVGSDFEILPLEMGNPYVKYNGKYPLLNKVRLYIKLQFTGGWGSGCNFSAHYDVVFDPLESQPKKIRDKNCDIDYGGSYIESANFCESTVASNISHLLWPKYFHKQRRFYESSSADDIKTVLNQSNNGSGNNPMGGENYQQNAQDLSEGWLEQLKACFTGPADPNRELLRARLIAVCVKGSDMSHPFGASSVPDGQVTSYGDHSFKDAIIAIFGTETPTCNELLIDFPLPYNAKTLLNDSILTKLSDCGYALLTRFKNEWIAAGGAGNPLHKTLKEYIRKKYDPNFYLSDAQMTELLAAYVSGCPVKRPFRIPGILTRCDDPKTPTCLKCTQLYKVEKQFNAAYPQFPNTLPNYYELLAAYINRVYQMQVSPSAVYAAIEKCKKDGGYNDGCGNQCNPVIASLQKFYQVMPLTEYYNKVYCQELNCEDVLAVFRTHITTWLNLSLGWNHDFNYYYNNYFDSCAIEVYQEPGCYYYNKYKQTLANSEDPCQCTASILRCCDTYAPFVTFRSLYPNPVDPRLMAFFFEMRRYTYCAPTNLPNISYTQPWAVLVNYFNNLVPNVIPGCEGGGGGSDMQVIAKENAKMGAVKPSTVQAINKDKVDISDACAGTISGNVWHDVNGMTDGYVNNSGGATVPPAINIPAGLYAYLVLPDYLSNLYISAVASVNSSTGTYTFGSRGCSYNYRIYISTVIASVGAAPPAVVLPVGWEHTGQQYGTGAGHDGTNDGILFTPTYGTIANANFGIRTGGAQSNCSSIWQFSYDSIRNPCTDIYDTVFGPGDFVLCSQPLTPVYQSDPDACIKSVVNASLSNAEYAYSQYIKDFMRDYREAYFAKCLSITPSLVMEGEQQEYHYTLYYYDQSGNLVKTVPPKGVTYLSLEHIQDVGLLRDEDNAECYKNSKAPVFTGNNQSLNVPSAFYPQQNAGALTVETWVKFDNTNNKQVILDKFDDAGPSVGKAGYYAYIENGKLYFSIYGRSQETWIQKGLHWLYPNLLPNVQAHYYTIDNDNIPRVRLFKASCRTENLITSSGPASEFYHLVFQYSGDPDDTRPVKIYVNGILQTLNWTNGYEHKFLDNLVNIPSTVVPTIDETKYEFKSFSSPFTTASTAALVAGSLTRTIDGVSVNGINGSMKQLRIYNAAPDAPDLRRSSYDACYMPSQKEGLVLWLPLNKATAGKTEDVQSGNSANITASWPNPATPRYPLHNMPTYYAYNSLNKVIHQETPDAGQSNLWYDRLGRLVVSQNAEQKIPTNGDQENRYSYTKYDEHGRITEVGEKTNVDDISSIDTKDQLQLDGWLNQGADRQVTQTVYDNPNPYVTTDLQILLEQLHHYNSRKRVVTSIYLENKGTPDDYNYASHYVYDISGNVKKLYQENKKLPNGNDVFTTKTLDYEFDLISGKVNQLWYQKTKQDQYLHRYAYDADNRLVNTQSGRDIPTLRYDARYSYHLHGHLARTELGHEIVQGVDYAYTLQGLIKGSNGLFLHTPGSGVDNNMDMGWDGIVGTDRAWIPSDVYGYTLGYHVNDYTPINDRGGLHPFSQKQFGFNNTINNGGIGYELFNGNVAYASYTNRMLGSNPLLPSAYSYGYDQLNRLKEMRNHEAFDAAGEWNASTIIEDYGESVAYDPNGNILSYSRKGNTASVLEMDELTYYYQDAVNNNKLDYVDDKIDGSNYTEDIDAQMPGNYIYDKIGNLIGDNSVDNKINEIQWTVYGKIRSIAKDDGTLIEYAYDPTGNRVSKTVTKDDVSTITHYFRDGTGNTIAVYEQSNEGLWTWKEQDLYGSSRLGMWKPEIEMTGDGIVVDSGGGDDLPPNPAGYDETIIGTRHYELTNHLGNVMSTISDMKTGVDEDGDDDIDYYIADVITANDYYPFGMGMPGRKYNNGAAYRYGFNGKEKSDEVYGDENVYDYGFRIYNPRIGKFLSVDPLEKEFPWYTPYQFAGNKPIWAVDIDGREDGFATMMMMDVMEKQHEAHARGEITYEQLVEQRFASMRAVGLGAAVGGGLAIEIFVTKGKITNFILASQLLGTLHHNRADPKQEAERNLQFKAAVTDIILGFAFNKFVGVVTKLSVSTGKIVYKTFNTASIRTTQTTVNGVEKYVQQFKAAGKYDAEPVDIVKMEDDIYSSIDHARLIAAEKLGFEARANAHKFDDIIPLKRAREIAGPDVKDADLPKTWGEAIKLRVSKQTGKYAKENPNGSFVRPKVKS